ncbi:MAG: hypothetical protein JNK45_07275, partial [Myxococcales bacterium]|nr:hypothetical protein [Myxococcales bacterium]
TIGAQGSEDWITVPGGLGRDVPGDVAIELGFGDGRIERRPAVVRTLADTADRQIVIPLPDGFDRVTSLARVEDGQRVAIDRARVRERHTQRRVQR